MTMDSAAEGRLDNAVRLQAGKVYESEGMRIDKHMVLEERYQYEVADDNESHGNPSRVNKGIW